MKHDISMRAGLEAGGAPAMWERVVQEALPLIRRLVPAGSRVLEVGYGDGMLTCYLCRELGWSVTGLEVCSEAHRRAVDQTKRCGLSGQVELHCCTPDETLGHAGEYDSVFVKTVLYSSRSIEEYQKWLDWVLSVLRPGGFLIDFETGRANALTQCYRRLRRRSYADLSLYTCEIEAIYDARFEIVYRRYYGGWSQFLAPVASLYRLAARLEEALAPRHADNCFIVGMIARKIGPHRAQ